MDGKKKKLLTEVECDDVREEIAEQEKDDLAERINREKLVED